MCVWSLCRAVIFYWCAPGPLWHLIGSSVGVCSQSLDCWASSLADTNPAAPLVEKLQFSSLQMASVCVISQECGSRAVYWVTVVSADSSWVSNSIYFFFVQLSNNCTVCCVWLVLTGQTCVGPRVVLSRSECKSTEITQQHPVVLAIRRLAWC